MNSNVRPANHRFGCGRHERGGPPAHLLHAGRVRPDEKSSGKYHPCPCSGRSVRKYTESLAGLTLFGYKEAYYIVSEGLVMGRLLNAGDHGAADRAAPIRAEYSEGWLLAAIALLAFLAELGILLRISYCPLAILLGCLLAFRNRVTRTSRWRSGWLE